MLLARPLPIKPGNHSPVRRSDSLGCSGRLADLAVAVPGGGGRCGGKGGSVFEAENTQDELEDQMSKTSDEHKHQAAEARREG